MDFKLPPILYNAQGQVRTVGFELEYSYLSIAASAEIVQQLYGGEVQVENKFKQKVVGTSLGDFTLEFDLTLLTEKRYKKVFKALNIKIDTINIGENTLQDEVEDTLGNLIGKVFPNEIACPPIPCTKLHQIEKLREALFQNNAEGTHSFPTNAFGTHINIEVPNTATATLVAYLKAFLLLYPWLLQVGETDLARKLSPFIDPFPPAYADLVLASDYKPSLEQFIRDYHKYNPNRNRPLDFYPLFAELNQELLAEFENLGKVKARDTFHYRLPNSSLSQPGWTLAAEWNNWIAVEELANNPQKLSELSLEYMSLKRHSLIGFDSKWIKRTEEWLS
ncbi:amidoligase family protein [uncultured Pontibacter sp.]|uniref:amidoligase family protein n=1 Tax=uncultured Pontibacter sp. TaxID=453356 RepID=UPI0026052F90|nr:amidoligase family protein [uncultured Pontibacter sp.]